MEDKIYFLPGDRVTLKQGIPNKPIMLVVKKVSKYITLKNSETINNFQGILCRWFTSEGLLQEAVWNTKDIIKI